MTVTKLLHNGSDSVGGGCYTCPMSENEDYSDFFTNHLTDEAMDEMDAILSDPAARMDA